MNRNVKLCEIKVDQINLDFNNPRIARILEIYPDRSMITAEMLSLALGTDSVEPSSTTSHTTFIGLKESIRSNGGIIHPILVNFHNNQYTVIEGNTRVQIYRDFRESGVPGDWDTIMAAVYCDLSPTDIHAIRLQSHLVGPRDWDAYAKAKYLNMLYTEEQLPFYQIVDFCGGDRAKTRKYIDAYQMMEAHYRPQLDSDDQFDAEKFSAFVEYQNGKVKRAVSQSGFSEDDFAKWIITEKIPQLAKVRQLPAVLSNPTAKQAFLKSNINDAIHILESYPTGGTLKDASLEQLASELAKRVRSMPYEIMKNYQNSPAYSEKKAIILEALDQLREFCDDICGGDG